MRVYLPQAHFGNDPRTRTAVHEAGHALLAWSSACVTTVTAATITADDDESSAGHVSFVTRDDAWSGFIPTHTFEVTGRAADIFDACYRRALTVVLAYRHRLDALASALEKKRRVDAAEIETLLGPRTSRMFR